MRETRGEIDGRDYRMIVIHSASLVERKEHSFARVAEKKQEALHAGRNLLQQTFHCREDADAAFAAALADLNLLFRETEQRVEAELIEPSRGRGRPKKTPAPPPSTLVYRAHLALAAGATRRSSARSASTRRSSSLPTTSAAPKELVPSYCGQANVEAAFRRLKGPVQEARAGGGLGYVMLMAYLVYALVQRAIRRALPEGEKLEVEGP